MARETVHKGRKIEVQIDTHTAPNGQLIKRDVILHPGAVVILPVIDREHVCLLKNFRFVVNETLWEAPAGTLEPKEEWQHAAERELLEETGYKATQWTYLGYLFASPGVMNEKLHLYIAENLTQHEAQPEPDEQLEPITLTMDEALKMCFDGRIKDSKTVSILLMWDRLRNSR
ncbi:NUDIX hydrolase [Telmatocola sphagniphila]|jgi:ADP-ribose pyrophosphatase|uniref:GDP-mannose pyrophosphatase n=1 Tax=Telmatocola sphagniphila TaxID=1123043 RepID=A0A8E6B9N2_9BACT|nr:NUDIX hydrolase [Telmatocola sphagniphila]QVL32930.1 NUDIX hydrolase [Telmatocola sphagniphila]